MSIDPRSSLPKLSKLLIAHSSTLFRQNMCRAHARVANLVSPGSRFTCILSLTPSVLRNKLSYTAAHLFLNVYPNTMPTFLRPFFELLVIPESSNTINFHPVLLTIHLLIEIAQEVHDSTMKSARQYSEARQARDGLIRDAIRTTGDERMAVDGLLALVERGLGVVERGGDPQGKKWTDVVDLAIKALASWTRESSGVLLPNTNIISSMDRYQYCAHTHITRFPSSAFESAHHCLSHIGSHRFPYLCRQRSSGSRRKATVAPSIGRTGRPRPTRSADTRYGRR
jgi:hypothetical protein